MEESSNIQVTFNQEGLDILQDKINRADKLINELKSVLNEIASSEVILEIH
jgi:hypothetical protein